MTDNSFRKITKLYDSNFIVRMLYKQVYWHSLLVLFVVCLLVCYILHVFHCTWCVLSSWLLINGHEWMNDVAFCQWRHAAIDYASQQIILMTLSTFFECMLTSLNPPSICKKCAWDLSGEGCYGTATDPMRKTYRRRRSGFTSAGRCSMPASNNNVNYTIYSNF